MKKAMGKKSTRIRPIFSLALTLIRMFRFAFNSSLVSLQSETLKNIWGFQPLWVEEKNKVSLTSRSMCEKTPRVEGEVTVSIWQRGVD